MVVSEEEDEELTTEEAKPAAADVSVKTTTENADATKADAVSSDGNKKQKRCKFNSFRPGQTLYVRI